MIGNLTKFNGGARAANLVAYMITAKGKEQRPEERVGATSSLLIPAGIVPDATDRAACTSYAADVAHFLKQWTRDARPNKAAPKSEFLHLTLSFHPDDPVTQFSALSIADEVLDEVVGKDRPRYMAVHVDKDHLHAHTLISTVDSKGRIFNPRFDYRLIEAACESAELRHGLTRVKQRKAMAKADPSRAVEVSAISTREMRRSLRMGAPAPRELLKQQLGAALDGSPNFGQFADRLAALGVRAVPHVASTGRVSGLSFAAPDGVIHKGSSLGKAFTFGAICQTTKYEPNKDYPIIDEWRSLSKDGRTNPSDGSAQKRACANAGNHCHEPDAYQHEARSDFAAPRESEQSTGGTNSSDRRTDKGAACLKRDMASSLSPAARHSGRTATTDSRVRETVAAISETFGCWASMTKPSHAGTPALLSLFAQLLNCVTAQVGEHDRSSYRRPKAAGILDSLDI